MPVKPIPPDEPDKAKPGAKRISQSDAPTNKRSRVTPYRWHDDEDGSKTIPSGHSNRSKGEWMKR
jgi:hypothetical protein